MYLRLLSLTKYTQKRPIKIADSIISYKRQHIVCQRPEVRCKTTAVRKANCYPSICLLLQIIQVILTKSSHESGSLVTAFNPTKLIPSPYLPNHLLQKNLNNSSTKKVSITPTVAEVVVNSSFSRICQKSIRMSASTSTSVLRSRLYITTKRSPLLSSSLSLSSHRLYHSRLFTVPERSKLSFPIHTPSGNNSPSSLGAVPSSSSSASTRSNSSSSNTTEHDKTEASLSSSTVSLSGALSEDSLKRLQEYMPKYDDDGRPYTSYEKCVRRLYLTNLFHPVKMGLENMKRLHEALGNPMDDPNKIVIHIAGTNGKGSVSLKIARTLQNAGHRVGLFVSPHVSSFRERVQINSEPITEEEVQTYLPDIYSICEKRCIPATFFEITTALAFSYFDKAGADVVVLETGLGGRLDATNVLVKPNLCVVTSIGLEHTRILGETIEEIGGEKAGIMKAGVPVLVGPNVPHAVMKVHAENKGVEGYYECVDVLGKELKSTTKEVNNKEYVDYDVENSQIATAALRLLQRKIQGGHNNSFSTGQPSKYLLPMTDANIEDGVSKRPPCRFEVMTCHSSTKSDSTTITTTNATATTINNTDNSTTNASKSVTVILDVAHNPPAMDLLVNKLKATYPHQTKRLVAGFSSDKDLSQCAKSLMSVVPNPSNLHLVEAAHPRAAKIEDMLKAEPKLKTSNFDEEDRSISAQVRSAVRLAGERGEILIVCGSVFIMSEVRQALGIEEPRDSKYIAEVAGSGMRSGQENFGDKDPEETIPAA